MPSEYPTIQSALNSVGTWDTVLVSSGRYHEYLSGPSQSFVLLGEFSPDSIEALRSVIDPIPPANADTPSVVTLIGDTTVIKNLVFFNRVELRQPDWATRAGGIRNFCGLLHMIKCSFDSVSAAIWGGDNIILDTCEFTGCVWQCVDPTSLTGSLTASYCRFEGAGYALVSAFDHSRIRNCVFECNTQGGHFLRIGGSDIRVSQCRFGPCFGAFPLMTVFPVENVEIVENTFEGIERATSLISVEASCLDWSEPPLRIRENVFRNYHRVPPTTGITAIDAECMLQTTGLLCSIEENLFQDGEASVLIPPGVCASGSLWLNRNLFTGLAPEDGPDVRAVRPFQDSIFASNNSFLPPGLAASTAGSYFDARNNWWGDSTGPYNLSENPIGQGSEVGNGVLFSPWLTQPPDTSDTNHVAADDIVILTPEKFSLAAYPNPFNATTTLTVEVAHPDEYEIDLFDVTGRHVAELFHGSIRSSHSLQINAEGFATGMYFARLKESNSTLAVTKLLLLK